MKGQKIFGIVCLVLILAGIALFVPQIKAETLSASPDTDVNYQSITDMPVKSTPAEQKQNIKIISARHLYQNKKVSDVFNETKAEDSIWTEPIYHNEYIRVVFESKITNGNVINLYLRNTQGLNTSVNIYEENGSAVIGSTPVITETKQYNIVLSNMSGYNNAFDLKVVNEQSDLSAFLEFDYIHDQASQNAMIVYAKAVTDSRIYYRNWTGSAWGSEGVAMQVGAGPEWFVLKSSAVRNESILGVIDTTGNIAVMVWDGDSWGNKLNISAISTTNDAYRGFDIAYENQEQQAIVVFNNDNAADPNYVIWNGTAWSGETTIGIPTTGALYWVELESNPFNNSNEIALMTLDANADIYGMIWNGTQWNNISATFTAWETFAAIATRKPFDIAYEQTTGRAMFMWANATATDQYYRLWNGSDSSLTAPTLLDISYSASVGNWVRLVPKPNSAQIMYGVQTATGPELSTALWSGSSWGTVADHSNITEDAQHRNFDMVWETYSGRGDVLWLMWGDSATVSKKNWTGSAWGTAAAVGDDTALVQLAATGAGAVLAVIVEDASSTTDDTSETHLTGGSSAWTSYVDIWTGANVDPAYEEVYMAAELYSPTELYPVVTLTHPTNTTYEMPGGNTTYGVSISYTAIDNDNRGISQCIREVNGTNTTIADCANLTVNFPAGTHTVKIWANDTNNIWESSALVTFSVDVAAGATCNYNGIGDWNVNCADDCVKSSPVDMGGNNIIFTNSGTFTMSAAITNYNQIQLSDGCKFTITNGIKLGT